MQIAGHSNGGQGLEIDGLTFARWQTFWIVERILR